MKMTMRLDKTQLGSPIKKYTASSTFKRDLYIMAGYTTYDVMCVGGSGGQCGTKTGAGQTMYPAGGGGGGSIMARGPLSDLPSSVTVTVGAKGADSSSGNGSDGGTSRIGTGVEAWSIEGYGGHGADVASYFSGPELQKGWTPAIGGSGGSNSESYGDVGDGGHCAGWSQNSFGVMNTYGATVATAGLADPVVNGNGGGGGGGGGRGRFEDAGGNGTDSTAASGANGSNGEGFGHTGQAAAGSVGGCGGGANLVLVTGVNEYYGSDGPGVVAIKVS